jgi:colanic acid/amylovoran biosynthesis protein
MKIVVLNLYGKHNLGDNAIRNVGLDIIDEAIPEKELSLLCETVENFPIQTKRTIEYRKEYAPYGYAIRSEGTAQPLWKKALRFGDIVFASIAYALLGKRWPSVIPENDMYRYITWLKEADLIIAMGGGYFITAKPLSDLFGIGLNILPMAIATKIFRKPLVLMPMSFGPFATGWHERLTAWAIAGSTFMSREEISTAALAKYSDIHVVQTPDLVALEWRDPHKGPKENYFVLTFREVLSGDAATQTALEAEVARFIFRMHQTYGLTCVFLPSAANPIEENDIPVGERIGTQVGNPDIYRIHQAKTPDEARDLLAKARFSACNRLHSAILSATVFTPFFTMSYAHKTVGFLRMMGLEEWNIGMGDVQAEDLVQKADVLMDRKTNERFINQLRKMRDILKPYRKKIADELAHAARKAVKAREYGGKRTG